MFQLRSTNLVLKSSIIWVSSQKWPLNHGCKPVLPFPPHLVTTVLHLKFAIVCVRTQVEQSRILSSFGQVMNGLAAVKQERNPLLDLLDLDVGGDSPAAAAATTLPGTLNSLDDILGLNLGNSLSALAAPAATANSFSLLDGFGSGGLLGGNISNITQNGGGGGLDSLLNGMDALSFAGQVGGGGGGAGVAPLTAYEKHGLRILFTFPGPYSRTATAVTLLAHNLTQQPVQNFVFQVIP